MVKRFQAAGRRGFYLRIERPGWSRPAIRALADIPSTTQTDQPLGTYVSVQASLDWREARFDLQEAGMRSLDPTRDEWLVALIRDVRASSGVGYRDLATALRAAIVSGEVPVGTKLPPQREFARLLSIGRTSVVAAHNVLRAESLLVTRQGAGTWVARRPDSEPRALRP